MLLILTGPGEFDLEDGDLPAEHPSGRLGSPSRIASSEHVLLEIGVRRLAGSDQRAKPSQFPEQIVVRQFAHVGECTRGREAAFRPPTSLSSMSNTRWRDAGGPAWTLVGLVTVMLVVWMLLVPQGGQPDEAGHLVRSAALVRLDSGGGAYELPDRFRIAEPACYAFDSTVPASCSEVPDHSDELVVLTSRAGNYPPGGHLLFGVASALPGLDPIWWGRLAAVAVAALLVGWSLVVAVRHEAATAAGLLVGLTPMAWSIMPAVNPSSFAIAGSAALWVGLLTSLPGRFTNSGTWLLVGGWTALIASRRDGLVWACIIVALTCLAQRYRPIDLVRRLDRAQLAVAGVATLGTLGWAVVIASGTARWSAVAPVAVVGAELAVRRWPLPGAVSVGARVLAITTIGAVSAAAWAVLVTARSGGWDTNLLLTLIAQTDENLIEAVGVLGWLDTPVPGLVVDAWLVTTGALVAVGIMAGTWRPAAVLAGATVITSWTFELVQGNDSGTYWQGRYSLPLLIGVPLLLVTRSGRVADRLVVPAATAALAFVNIAAWAAARRYGVGHLGSHLPWRWDTPLHPVPPLVLLIVLAIASVGLLVVLLRDEVDRLPAAGR